MNTRIGKELKSLLKGKNTYILGAKNLCNVMTGSNTSTTQRQENKIEKE